MKGNLDGPVIVAKDLEKADYTLSKYPKMMILLTLKVDLWIQNKKM